MVKITEANTTGVPDPKFHVGQLVRVGKFQGIITRSDYILQIRTANIYGDDNELIYYVGSWMYTVSPSIGDSKQLREVFLSSW